MPLDIRTLFFLSLINGLLLGVAQLVVWRSQRSFPSLWLWSLSNFAGAAGSFLVALRGMAPDIFSIALGNALVLAWLMLLWAGMRRFDRQPLPLWWMVAAPVALFFAFTLPVMVQNLAWRTMIVAGLTGLLLTIGTWDLWRAQKSEPLAIRRFLIVLFATAAPLCYLRVFLSAGLDPTASFMSVSDMQALMLVHMNLFVLGWNIGGLLLVNERLQNQLAHAARHDVLTGLFNQRTFIEQADRRLDDARTLNDAVAFILIGLKQLASYNYHLGHVGTDDCLRRVGALIQQQVRAVNGIAGSLGGEQFVIMLSQRPAADAETFVQQLQVELERAQIPHPGAPQGFAALIFAVVSAPAREHTSARASAQLADERLLRVRTHARYQHVEVAA